MREDWMCINYVSEEYRVIPKPDNTSRGLIRTRQQNLIVWKAGRFPGLCFYVWIICGFGIWLSKTTWSEAPPLSKKLQDGWDRLEFDPVIDRARVWWSIRATEAPLRRENHPSRREWRRWRIGAPAEQTAKVNSAAAASQPCLRSCEATCLLFHSRVFDCDRWSLRLLCFHGCAAWWLAARQIIDRATELLYMC